MAAYPPDAVPDLLQELERGDALTRDFAAECVAQYRLECAVLAGSALSAPETDGKEGIRSAREWLAGELERLLGWARSAGRIAAVPVERKVEKKAA